MSTTPTAHEVRVARGRRAAVLLAAALALGGLSVWRGWGPLRVSWTVWWAGSDRVRLGEDLLAIGPGAAHDVAWYLGSRRQTRALAAEDALVQWWQQGVLDAASASALAERCATLRVRARRAYRVGDPVRVWLASGRRPELRSGRDVRFVVRVEADRVGGTGEPVVQDAALVPADFVQVADRWLAQVQVRAGRLATGRYRLRVTVGLCPGTGGTPIPVVPRPGPEPGWWSRWMAGSADQRDGDGLWEFDIVRQLPASELSAVDAPAVDRQMRAILMPRVARDEPMGDGRRRVDVALVCRHSLPVALAARLVGRQAKRVVTLARVYCPAGRPVARYWEGLVVPGEFTNGKVEFVLEPDADVALRLPDVHRYWGGRLVAGGR